MLVLSKSINTIARCTMQYRNDKLADLNISGFQSTYILHICRNPGISQDALAKMIYVNKSNVTRQLAGLEENGLIKRLSSKNDQRVIEVFPTQKALDVLPQVYQVLHKWNEYLTAELSIEEEEIFFLILQKITTRAKNYFDQQNKE